MPLGSGGAGGLGAIGMFIMPISIAVMLLKQPPGPVSKLIKAGALDPETARRAERLEIPRPFVARAPAALMKGMEDFPQSHAQLHQEEVLHTHRMLEASAARINNAQQEVFSPTYVSCIYNYSDIRIDFHYLSTITCY